MVILSLSALISGLWTPWLLGKPVDGSPRQVVTVQKVERLVRHHGARVALQQVFKDNRAWNEVLTGIATGSGRWLRVAKTLRAVSDAGATEGLAMAVQEALPRAARGVLLLVSQRSTPGQFDVAEVCGGYGFGQIDDDRPTAILLRLVRERVVAVEGVQDRSLDAVRDLCKAELARLERDLSQK